MSALTSLLARDEVVSVQLIEDALQCQVLEGGEIDTALLELGAVSENTLNAYRAAAFGAEAASREELMQVSDDTLKMVSVEVAAAFRVVPVTRVADRLWVCAANPLSEDTLGRLQAALGLQVSVKVAVEVRVEAALATFYGVQISPRLRLLAESLERVSSGLLPQVRPPDTQLLRVDDAILRAYRDSQRITSAASAAPRVAAGGSPAGAGTSSVAYHVMAVPRAPQPGQRPAVVPTDVQPLEDPWRAREREQVVIQEPVSGHAPTLPRTPLPLAPTATFSLTDGVGASESSAGLSSIPPLPARRRRRGIVPKGPLTLERAHELLDGTGDRDAVLEVFFAFARQYFDASVLFSVRRECLLPLDHHGLVHPAPVTGGTEVPVQAGGAVASALTTMVPRVSYLGRVKADAGLVEALGRRIEPVLLLPVAIRQRNVLLFYGDRDGDPLALDELGEVLEVASLVSTELSRIIRSRKLHAMRSEPALRSSLPPGGTTRAAPENPAGVGREVHDSVVAPASAHVPTETGGDAVSAEESASKALSPEGMAALATLGLSRPLPAPPRLPTVASAAAVLGSEPAPADSGREHGFSYLSSKPPPGTGAYRMDGAGDKPSQGQGRMATELVARPAATDDAAQACLVTTDVEAPADETDVEAPADEEASGRTTMVDAAPPAVSSTLQSLTEIDIRGDEPPVSAEAAKHVQPSVAPGAGLEPSPTTLETVEHMVGAGAEGHALVNEGPAAEPLAVEPPVEGTGSPLAEATAELAGSPLAEATAELAGSPLAEATAELAGSPLAEATAELPPPEPLVIVDLDEDSERLLDSLVACGPGEEGPVIEALLRIGDAVLPGLVERFPGPCWVERRLALRRLPAGRDVSAVARALAAFGERAVPHVAGLIQSTGDSEQRFLAVLLSTDRVAPAYLRVYRELLFDNEGQLRLLVRDVLFSYRAEPGFAELVARLLEMVGNQALPVLRRLDALEALCAVRTARALPLLIELLGDNERQLAVPAHRALVLITGHDLGSAARRWRVFAKEHAGRARAEWLMDGLMGPDESVRATSGAELQRLTQQYYGYVASASKWDRARIQRRYQEWWRAEGHTDPSAWA